MSSSAIAREEEEEEEPEEEEEEEEEPEEEEEEEEPEEEEEEEEEEEPEEEEEEEEEEEKEEEKKKEETTPPPPPVPPVLESIQQLQTLESIQQLQTLHSALSDFFLHYNSLHQTLTYIQTNLNSLDPDKKEEIKKEEEKKESESPDLDAICSATASKDLRKYISSRLHEVHRLREEVPEALRRTPNRARLVLSAVGRFFVQGRRTYERPNSPAVSFRRACILLLELYLLAGPDPAPDPSVRKDARVAAMDWKGRMEHEGGVESASAVDALGLVLLIACFGVPSEFRPGDLYTLLRLSNLKKKADVLRRSSILLEKMPDIIKDMIKRNMEVEAVDLICAFELGEKFPVLPLLSSFVQMTCEKEASQKQLVALKLVKKCLNEHKLDASELASLDIDQKIATLEKEMSMFERKFQENKRKIEDVKSFKTPEPRVKRPWPASTGATYGMIERSGIGLSAGSIHGQAVGRHGNEVVYVDSVGPSLLGGQYLPGNNFTGQSAAGGESFYQPPALPHSLVNNFTGHSAVAGQSFYQPPALPHSSMNNFSGQSAAAGQGYYYPTDLSHGMGDVALGKNIYQFADTALQHDPYYGKATTSNAVSTVTNTGHHVQADYARAHFGDGSSFNRSH